MALEKHRANSVLFRKFLILRLSGQFFARFSFDIEKDLKEAPLLYRKRIEIKTSTHSTEEHHGK
jgi:hypothetical protein